MFTADQVRAFVREEFAAAQRRARGIVPSSEHVEGRVVHRDVKPENVSKRRRIIDQGSNRA